MFKFYSKSFLILIIILNFVGCSVEELYEIAINYERSNANLELKSISLDFGKVAYLENKNLSDSSIILLHGFGGDKDNWNRFSAELNGNNHIVVLDLPGHGESVSIDNLDYSISHQVVMLDQFLTAKNIKSVHIAGNSMGGAIALSYANHFPKKVKSLILFDSLGMIKTKSELSKLIEQGTNPFFNICSEKSFKNLLAFGMHEIPYITGIFMDKLVSDKCARADIEKIIYENMIANSVLTKEAKNIKVPTLIIWGRKDRILHVDNAELFHETIKDSQLVILDDYGHVPLLEAPEKTAQLVETFIKKIN